MFEGLKIDSAKSITLGRCELRKHNRNSELSQILEQDKIRWKKQNEKTKKTNIFKRIKAYLTCKRWKNQNEETGKTDIFKRVKAYLTCEITGHPQKAIARAIAETDLALSILRLYIASFYFHEYREKNTVYRMGLAGTLNFDERLRVFYINPNKPIVDQYPGYNGQRLISEDLEIDDGLIEHMMENGLENLNKLLQSLDLNRSGDDVARRLLRAITWFAKGTHAQSIADSFLMYAIALEGLLSEGRTSQETYATQVAALVTCTDDGWPAIYPVGGAISKPFSKQLRNAKTLNDRYNLVRNRVLDLFSYRNDIAHGAILEDEIDDINLLDFETLIENAILSFIKGGWESLRAFKDWANKSVRYDFNPQ